MSSRKGGYVPPPSIGHEIGVMFGFGGAMVLLMAVYYVMWKMGNKRSARRENARREALSEKGFYSGSKRDGRYATTLVEGDEARGEISEKKSGVAVHVE